MAEEMRIEKKVRIQLEIDAKTDIEAEVIQENLQKFYDHFGDVRFATLVGNIGKIMKMKVLGVNVGDKIMEQIDSFIPKNKKKR